jgi:hypothetical protein
MRFLKIIDYITIIISITVIAIICFSVYKNENSRLFVFIQNNREELIFPLSINKDISVKGPIGTTVISIKNNNVKVIESPCRNKLCMNCKSLHKNGDWTACLPNLVFVSIKGKNEEKTDSISF